MSVRRERLEVGFRILKYDAIPKERSSSFGALLQCSREGKIPGEDLEELADYYAFWEMYGALPEEKIAEHVLDESEFFHVGEYGLFYGDCQDPEAKRLVEEEKEKIENGLAGNAGGREVSDYSEDQDAGG